MLLFGLPADWSLSLGPAGPVWHASIAGLVAICLICGALVWLLSALLVGILVWVFSSWRSAVRKLVVPLPQAPGEPEIVAENPAPELGLIAALVAVILMACAFMRSMLLLRAVLLLGLGAASMVVAMQLLSAIGQNAPIEVRSRGGGLGGSIGGWRISSPFGLIIVLLILVGGMVGVAQVDRPAVPPPPAAKPEPPPAMPAHPP